MWRFKLLVVTVAVLGVLLFGAVVAHARGWSWNSQVNVEGTDVRTEWTASQGLAPPPALPAAPGTITNTASASGSEVDRISENNMVMEKTTVVPFMLGMGDSIGEGVQSADASLRTQHFSYLAFLARQIDVPLPCNRGVISPLANREILWCHISRGFCYGLDNCIEI